MVWWLAIHVPGLRYSWAEFSFKVPQKHLFYGSSVDSCLIDVAIVTWLCDITIDNLCIKKYLFLLCLKFTCRPVDMVGTQSRRFNFGLLKSLVLHVFMACQWKSRQTGLQVDLVWYKRRASKKLRINWIPF